MSTADEPRPSEAEPTVICPTCGDAALWKANANRPFCSLTCRLVDLGVWLDEGYRVPGDDSGNVS
jgi:uncharacterized protein